MCRYSGFTWPNPAMTLMLPPRCVRAGRFISPLWSPRCRPRYPSNRADSALYMCLTAMVLTPTARLLELLELLQTQPAVTGREISDRLGIDARTVRRDITALRDLGIPVAGQRGAGGGYAMRPGFRLPPLMLNDDEAVAVALGVVAAGRLGLAGTPASVETRPGQDPPRPARCAAPPGRGARGRRSTSRRLRRSAVPGAGRHGARCSPARSAAGGGCGRPTGRSPASGHGGS